MTTEEKAKAYDEALEKARRIKNGEGDWRYSDLIEIGPALTEIFPQLAESEDEIHRKWILEYLYDGLRKADEQFKDHFKSAIDWLEKQKEQKPADDKAFEKWSDEDEKTLNAIIDMVGNSLYEPLRPRAVILSWLNSLRPSWKPSDEQMNGLAHAINLDVYDAKRYKLDSLYNDLKKLM